MAILAFCLSAAILLYVVVAYPLLLLIFSRFAARPIRKELSYRSVSIILPVRNGERWIEAKLRSILELDYPRSLLQILVVSDGSTDRTVESVGRVAGVQLIEIPSSGKAVALNTALKQASGEILFFTDVRQRLDRSSLSNLIACFADPTVGVVSGELMIVEGESSEEANTGLYWRYEKLIRKSLSALGSIPGATGCIYAMRRELAVPMPADTINDDMHEPLAAYFRGYRVLLEDSAKAYDHPTSLKTEFGRKVRTLAGVYQTIGQYPGVLNPRHGIWIHFVSHKLGRLLLPFALIGIALSSFWLPRPWNTLAIGAQLVFYGVAAADLALPEGFPLKRVTSPIRAFVVLMAAALCATSVLFRDSRSFWRPSHE
jgi:biofilm PGA synthesis N-glycosyltransferase PgaC